MSVIDDLLTDASKLLSEELPKLEALSAAVLDAIAQKRVASPTVGDIAAEAGSIAADAVEDAKFK